MSSREVLAAAREPYSRLATYLRPYKARFALGILFGLLAGATDVDSPVVSGGPRNYPAHGILQWESDGSFRYTPYANFAGTDSFAYRVSDGLANSPDQTVTITVTAINDLPVAAAQSVVWHSTVSAGSWPAWTWRSTKPQTSFSQA